MTQGEFMEWAAFYELEPWGSKLDGMRMGLNTASVLNAGMMALDPKRLRNKPYKAQDFFIGVAKHSRPKRKEESWETVKRQLGSLFPIRKDTTPNG
jgi:hypothetical protein